jgi:NitT/TauT family transport system ATP-binding protein
MIEAIRQAGFSPTYLQHAKDFNLSHPDAFQTLTEDELNSKDL